MGRKIKMDYESENDRVQVSFTVYAKTKDRIARAAARHQRTMGQQMEQSLEDGINLQGLIAKVSDYKTVRFEDEFGETTELKPNEDVCIAFIIEKVETAIKQGL